MANNWSKIIKTNFKSNSLEAKYLKHVPKIMDCDWRNAKFLGRVKYKFEHAELNGGLVDVSDGIFYINAKQLAALATVYKWNTGKIIKIK